MRERVDEIHKNKIENGHLERTGQKDPMFSSTSSRFYQICFLQRTIGNNAVHRLIDSGVIQNHQQTATETSDVAFSSVTKVIIKSACLSDNALFVTFENDVDANMIFEFLFELKYNSQARLRLYKKYKDLSSVRFERMEPSGKEWRISQFNIIDKIIRPNPRRLLGSLESCKFTKTEIEKSSEQRTYANAQKGKNERITFQELESFLCKGERSMLSGKGGSTSRCTLLAADEKEENIKPVENRFAGRPVRVPVRFSRKNWWGETETPYLPEYIELEPGTQIGPVRFLGRHSAGFVFKRWSEVFKLWLVVIYPATQCANELGEIIAADPAIGEKLRKK